MKRNKLLLFSASLFLSALIQAQGPTGILSYNAFIENVKANHPLIQKAGNVSNVGILQQKSARGLFDPQINAVLDQKTFSGKSYYTTAIAEIKQPLFTGQSLKAGIEYGQGSFINNEEVTPSTGLPYVGLEFSVLQGLVIDKRRYEVKKSGHYKELLQAESKIQMNDVLLTASEQYVQWLKDFTTAEVNQRFIETARQRFQALVTLSKIGERPAIDTVESAILLQAREIDYGYARMHLTQSLYQLYNFRWDSDSVLPRYALTPSTSLSELEERCLAAFLKRSEPNVLLNPGMLAYDSKNKLLLLEKRYKAELIKPRLDIKYNLLGNGSSTNPYYSNNYKWGAGFSMPLFFRNPVNDFKIARIQLRNNELEQKNKGVELENKSKAISSMLKVMGEQVLTAKKNLAYTRLLLEAEKLKFENNESSLFLLNTRETKVLESEIKLIELQEKFLLYYFYLVHLSGDLQYSIAE